MALAAVYSSLRLTKLLPGGAKKLFDHVYLFFGAGEAGTGIAQLIASAIEADEGVSAEEARRRIWLVDSRGLVCKARTDSLAPHKLPFAHETNVKFEDSLADTITALKVTVLIGASAQAQAFTRQVVDAMSANAPRPVICALSNPTEKSECTSEQAISWTNGKCIFASGSPYAKVKLSNPDREFTTSQANNAYIFVRFF